MSLFSFFCKEDLKFWKKAPQTVTNIQFINNNLFVLYLKVDFEYHDIKDKYKYYFMKNLKLIKGDLHEG